MKRVSASVLLICLYAVAALEITTPARAIPTDTLVTVGEISAASVQAGDTAVVVIPVVVAEGFHVQANPASDEFLIPLEITLVLDPPDSLVSWEVRYPPPEKFRLEGTTEDLLTYGDTVGVEIIIRADAEAHGPEWSFTGKLRYQACDARRCYFPSELPLTFTVVASR